MTAAAQVTLPSGRLMISKKNSPTTITRAEFYLTVSGNFTFFFIALPVFDMKDDCSRLVFSRFLLVTAFVLQLAYFIAGWRERNKQAKESDNPISNSEA